MAELSLTERQKLVQSAIQEARGSSDVYVVELFDDHAIYEWYGDGSDAGKSFDVPYTIAADGTVTLGDRTQVERQVTYMATYMAVKSVGPDTIEGPAFLFNRDLGGEAFDADTDFCLDWFGKSGRPLLYEHGMDRELKATLTGRQTEYESRDEGIWAQSELDRSTRYRKAIDRLIERGALAYSGGAMPHLATKNAKGVITRFPWVELSLTPTPMNPRNSGVYYVKSADAIAHLEAVHIAIPDPLKAALAALDEWAESKAGSGSELAYTDHLTRVLGEAEVLTSRSIDRAAWRGKAGRGLSAQNRTQLIELHARLAAGTSQAGEVLADLDQLLTSTDSEPSAAKAALWHAVLAVEVARARALGVPAGEPA